MRAYSRFLADTKSLAFKDYDALHQWSIDNQAAFWESITQFFKLDFDTPFQEVYVPATPFWKAKWFTGAQLSYAHHVLRNATPAQPAIIHQNETSEGVEISWQQLIAKTHALQLTSTWDSVRISSLLSIPLLTCLYNGGGAHTLIGR